MFSHDLRIAGRRLMLARASTLAAAGMLAMGIGTAVVMADMLDRLLLRPPPHVASPERVARLYLQSPKTGAAYALSTNYVLLERLGAAMRPDIELTATWFTETLTVGSGPSAQALNVVDVSEAYFDVLGVTPRLGVLPSVRGSAQGARGADVAVISHALWQQRFGGSPAVIGEPLTLATRTYTIVAVTPPGFAIDADRVDVWLPLESRAPTVLRPDWRTSTAYSQLPAIARLREGLDRHAAAQRVTRIYENLRLETASEAARRRYRASTEPHDRVVLGDLVPARAPGRSKDVNVAIWVTAMAALVLLMACGNAGSLLLVRGLGRDRELAVKTALGATRARLAREILLDALLIALGAGLAAWLFVLIAGDSARTLLLPQVVASATPLDARLVLLTVGASIASAFLLGIIPALRLTTHRRLTHHPAALASAGRPSRLLDLFAGFQLALSVPLIVGAGLFALSLWHARQEDFGFDTMHLAVVSTNMAEAGRPQDTHTTHRLLQQRLAQVAGVQAAALTQQTPMRGAMSAAITIPGHPFQPGEALPFTNAVDPTFFEVMGMRLIEGRTFTVAENTKDGPKAVVVNESLARTFWPDGDALGRCIQIGDTTCAPVVGVVADAAMWAVLERQARAETWAATCYVPIEQFTDMSPARAVLVRTIGNPHDLLPALRRAAQAAGPTLPFVDVWAFDDLFLPMLRPWRLGSALFVIFGAMSLLIACIGLAVVSHYGVTWRTRELGIRLVLGAHPVHLVAQVLRRSLVSLCGGLAVGLVMAYAGGHWLASVLFGITMRDWTTCVALCVLLLTISLVAAWLPARRVARLDPAMSLRPE